MRQAIEVTRDTIPLLSATNDAILTDTKIQKCGGSFLALLDYVSRAHEIEICPSSVVRPSVRITIISEPNARICFKFWLLLPLSHTLGRFLNF